MNLIPYMNVKNKETLYFIKKYESRYPTVADCRVFKKNYFQKQVGYRDSSDIELFSGVFTEARCVSNLVFIFKKIAPLLH